jgi:hypothetical protein
MASGENVVTDPAEVLKKIQEDLASRDTRVKELEADLKSMTGRHTFQKNRADRSEEAVKALTQSLEAASSLSTDLVSELDSLRNSASPKGTHVVLDGVRHDVIGAFRADNTFVEVKRGYCPEGVTLVAIDKKH